FCVASVLGSSCTTCTLRSCAPYAPINSSKYLCFERSLIFPKAKFSRSILLVGSFVNHLYYAKFQIACSGEGGHGHCHP
ncbi:MAG: hypothetical protein LBJ16_04135, partial [Holosporaceae bacterium]|nr:hypothetical protein [Holosporaceae bacterium]